MFTVKAMSLLHKTPAKDDLSAADILGIMKDRKELFVTVRIFGYTRKFDEARRMSIFDVPKVYFQHYLEREDDGIYYYIYDYVAVYDDDRPIIVYRDYKPKEVRCNGEDLTKQSAAERVPEGRTASE